MALNALRLKEETRELHDRLEAVAESSRIFDRTYTRRDYAEFLLNTYQFHKCYEEIVFAALDSEIAENLQVQSRSKLKSLEEDLKLLIENFEPDSLQECETLPLNPAEALGFLYVMEGSSLGGNIIRKNLQKNPQFEGFPFNYHTIYKDEIAAKWKQLQEIINLQNNPDDMISGARKVYSLMISIAHKNKVI